MNLSINLYKRSREILLKCHQFESDASLRAIFSVAELSFCQIALRESGTRDERINGLLAQLPGMKTAEGQSVFPLFIEVLRAHYHPHQEMYRELEQLLQEISRDSQNTITVPFVIVAMTRAEAEELFAGHILDHPSVAPLAKAHFGKLRQALEQHGEIDWISHYQHDREDWSPYIRQNYPCQSIRQIIQRLFSDVEPRFLGPKIVKPIPAFVSENFFSNDWAERQKTWDELGNCGCILVIDSISIFHPQIRKMLRDSSVSACENVAILGLSPFNPTPNLISDVIEGELKANLDRAFMRFVEKLDPLCEFVVEDLRALQRWFCSTLPETIEILQQRRVQTNRGLLYRHKMPRGYGNLIFGTSESQ